jgi:fermentation-respiration switch protein FrsA (DUF1100 family)
MGKQGLVMAGITMSGVVRGISAGLLLLVLIYLGLTLYLYLSQAGMLYLPDFPGENRDITPADAGLAYEQIELTTADGLHLAAWFVPGPTKARGVILFCHGNAGTIASRITTLELLQGLGFATLIFDYRGYGDSEGRPSEQGTYRDAEAAWQYLRGQGYAGDEIIIMGRSLGAAVAAQLASRHSPGAVVLESTFTSVPDVAAELYPLFPVRFISRFHYNTLSRMPAIHAPLLIVHSRDDEIIPYSHGRRLFAAANEPKQFLELKGGHNDSIYVSGIEYYRRGLDDFFRHYVDRR